MNRFEVHELMDILYSYENDDAMDYGSWDNELMDDEFYSRYEFLRRNKIVELTDTGCDARLPGQYKKNNFTSKLKKIKKLDDSKSNKKIHEAGPKDQMPKIHGKKYSPFKDELKTNSKAPKKNSLLNLAVSNSTFVLSDRETRRPTTKFEDFFDDFGDINHDEDFNDYEEDGIQNRRKFVDRAVDSDCLSNSSKCAEEKEISDLEIHGKLKNGEKKASDDSNIVKNEKRTKRIARTKLLTRSSNNPNEDVCSENKSRLKSNNFAPKTISSTVKNLENRESNSNTLQGRQKLGAASRTTIKENLKVPKRAPETLKPSKSFLKDDEKDSHVVKKVFFQGSKLPVWQGWHKKSKVQNINRAKKQKEMNNKKFEGDIDVTSITAENKGVRQNGDVQINVNKAEKSTEENTEDFTNGKAKSRLTNSKLGDSVEISKDDLVTLKTVAFLETRQKTEVEMIENCSDEEIVKHGEDNNFKNVEKDEISAETKRSREITSKDETSSELWTENCEKAYARGRAIGLKVQRMAKIAREKTSKEFVKYDFEEELLLAKLF